ncbi:MAG: RNA polymerase sigma-54 factor [Clostridia bacterium]|nr:RNA polymerase sigma-54 factor [Clostridia bacterium]
MELGMTLKQTQTLSPQMMQSMEILQMGSQELLEYIENQVQENPILEVEEKDGPPDETAVLQRKLEWLEAGDVQNRVYHQQDSEDDGTDPISNYGSADEMEENLCFYVLSQLESLDLEAELMAACRYLVESLDQNGWLDESVESIAAQLAKPVTLVEAALREVQELEPAGVAARNLSECLMLQLERRGEAGTLAEAIARDYLDPLSKNRYGLIAKELGVTQEEVREACELIRTLNPRPGSGFASRENLVYINPDLFVVNFPDHFELLTNDYFFPNLGISSYYCRMMKDTDESEVKDYLADKVRQAKWVVHSIEQRRGTLMKCAECLLDLQERFFRRGPGHLVPMSLGDIAERVGVHESTVSRAVKDKYIQCSSGVYPLSYFFSRCLGTKRADHQDTSSPDFAKALLKKLIAGEDKKKPLSDQKLCELMEQEKCAISRRTVAKYRDELNIPSTTGRKQYE